MSQLRKAYETGYAAGAKAVETEALRVLGAVLDSVEGKRVVVSDTTFDGAERLVIAVTKDEATGGLAFEVKRD